MGAIVSSRCGALLSPFQNVCPNEVRGNGHTSPVTLVQTLVTAKHILQVSDRRLTTSTGALFDDSHNKAVSWCGEFALGFTGIAYINRTQTQPTSEWITEALCGQSGIHDAAGVLRDGLTDAISKLPRAWPDKRLSVIMTGFGTEPVSGDRIPTLFRISNFELGDQQFATHRAEFVYEVGPSIDKGGFVYTTAGASLTVNEHRLLRRRLGRLVREDAWNHLVRLLVVMQRQVAKRNSTVGHDAMVVSIPRQSESRGVLLTDPTSLDVDTKLPMFTLVPEGGLEATRLGPHFVCGDSAMADLVTSTDLDRPDAQSVSVRILRLPGSPPA